MAQVTQYTCGACGRDILTVEHDGQPVPIVVYLVAGRHPDAPNVDVNAIPLPRFVREMLNLPTARMDWCVPCLAQALGHPLVTVQPHEDEAASAHQRQVLAGLPPDAVLSRADRDVAERARVVQALKAKGKAIDPSPRAGRRRSAAERAGDHDST